MNLNELTKIISIYELFSPYLGQVLFSSRINLVSQWMQSGKTVAGRDDHGHQLYELSLASSIFVDDDEECNYIAEGSNNSIVQCKCGANFGKVVAGGNEQAHQM